MSKLLFELNPASALLSRLLTGTSVFILILSRARYLRLKLLRCEFSNLFFVVVGLSLKLIDCFLSLCGLVSDV